MALPVLRRVVINVPKLKTHMLTIFTNAIKILTAAFRRAKMMLHRLIRRRGILPFDRNGVAGSAGTD